MEAPGWLMACKVLSVAQVITVAGSVWISLTRIQYAPNLLTLW